MAITVFITIDDFATKTTNLLGTQNISKYNLFNVHGFIFDTQIIVWTIFHIFINQKQPDDYNYMDFYGKKKVPDTNTITMDETISIPHLQCVKLH